jgi:cysteinyl-tRNA synthetase
MHIYDSSKKKKILFAPIKKNEVSIYICGPTVYDYSHLGHARSAICFDLLHRVFLEIGYRVTVAKNFTDIDDKIIKKANDTKESLKDITKYYIDSYKRDMKSLYILDVSSEPKATDYISKMILFVQELLDKNIAYIIDDGVYFDISKDDNYGTISNKILENSISRIGDNKQKKNQQDFAIWKFSKQNEPFYDASFGNGRPGWHLECSAMIDNIFSGDDNFSIDIHAGGIDLLFPHHENEASKTRCAKNKEIAKYWMHNGFVNIDNIKMSKSLDNSLFLKDILEKFDGEVVRLYLNSVHYRSDFNFIIDDLHTTKKRLDKLYRLKKRVGTFSSEQIRDKEFEDSILNALKDDLNISIALSLLDDFVTTSNMELDKKNKIIVKKINSNLCFINRLLAIGGKNSYEYFQHGISKENKSKIATLIEQRDVAKKSKNFVLADEIKKEILDFGVVVSDTPNGTLWEAL